jgi:hypothetical protein
MVGTLVDLFSIYKCPTTNIKAANTIVNKALANWWTWFILPHPINAFTLGERCSGQLSSAQSDEESWAMKPQEHRFYRLPAAAPLCGGSMSTQRLGELT